MPGTMKMFCIRMKILSHRNNIVLFLACNMAAVQNLYTPLVLFFFCGGGGGGAYSRLGAY